MPNIIESIEQKKLNNRLAQRAFRQRQQRKLSILERDSIQINTKNQALLDKNEVLRNEIQDLRTENNALRYQIETSSEFTRAQNLGSTIAVGTHRQFQDLDWQDCISEQDNCSTAYGDDSPLSRNLLLEQRIGSSVLDTAPDIRR